MLKRLKIYIFIFTGLVILASSCTENIDISTNAAAPQLVVEANIGTRGPAVVLLSKTISINDTDSFPKVNNAIVTIADTMGFTDTLKEVSEGIYISNMRGRVGQSYQLKVESQGKTITGTSTIPGFVRIDSLSVEHTIPPGAGTFTGTEQSTGLYQIGLGFLDPANVKNYYRVLLYFNGELKSGNTVFSDKYTDGMRVQHIIPLYNPALYSGDTLTVELECIDKPVYDYFESMGNSSMGPRNSSSPANPYTNLTGAILGYFSAHTVDRRNYIIP